jgi:hypothetical protein
LGCVGRGYLRRRASCRARGPEREKDVCRMKSRLAQRSAQLHLPPVP